MNRLWIQFRVQDLGLKVWILGCRVQTLRWLRPWRAWTPGWCWRHHPRHLVEWRRVQSRLHGILWSDPVSMVSLDMDGIVRCEWCRLMWMVSSWYEWNCIVGYDWYRQILMVSSDMNNVVWYEWYRLDMNGIVSSDMNGIVWYNGVEAKLTTSVTPLNDDRNTTYQSLAFISCMTINVFWIWHLMCRFHSSLMWGNGTKKRNTWQGCFSNPFPHYKCYKINLIDRCMCFGLIDRVML